MEIMKNMLREGSTNLGYPLDDDKIDSLIKYFNILIERNKVVNLTRITTPEDVVTKHFLDSITTMLTEYVGNNIIDVGTGAGFPGLVIKCVAPEKHMTLLDSLNKRITFLKDAAKEMNVNDSISFLHSRAEDVGTDKIHREKYDTVVSRAVANMRTLSEWCLPLLSVGGYFLALKGPLADEELKDAIPAIKVLGGKVVDVFETRIPYTELNHKIIIVKKIKHTPTQFPRKGKKSTEIPVEKAIKK